MGFVLALCFALGVGLIAAGLSRTSLEPESWRRLIASQRDRPLVSGRVLCLAGLLALAAGALLWWIVSVPALALVGALAGAYLPIARARNRDEQAQRERERSWPAALAQLADALEAGIAFPAAVSLLAEAGPASLRAEFSSFRARARVRGAGLESALDQLARAGDRTADTVALLLRAGLLELPAGRLAPLLRELSEMLAERFEAREKARSRASSLQIEAALLALSPIALLLLIGSSSPGYLNAYRTPAGTVVATVSSVLIFGCYLLMRRLGRVPEPRRTGPRR
jgi:tight adherence protein B